MSALIRIKRFGLCAAAGVLLLGCTPSVVTPNPPSQARPTSVQSSPGPIDSPSKTPLPTEFVFSPTPRPSEAVQATTVQTPTSPFLAPAVTATLDPAIIVQLLQKQIVFVSDRDGPQEIFIMRGDGTDQKKLTDDGFDKSHPTWSHDGQRIAFIVKKASTDGELFSSGVGVMDASGSNGFEAIPPQEWQITSLTWSPDDRQIAVVGHLLQVDPAFPESNIYVIDLVTNELTQITEVPSGNAGCWSPSWSPDGANLVFVCRALMGVELVIAENDGSDMWGFDFLGQVERAFWLPSGKTIAYSGGYCEIGSFDAEYMLQRGAVDFGDYPCLDPELEALNYEYHLIFASLWSPTMDARFLVQSSDMMQVIDLAQGTIDRVMGNFANLAGEVSWGPAEDWIVYSVHDGDDAEIAVFDLVHLVPMTLTDNEFDDIMPAWQP